MANDVEKKRVGLKQQVLANQQRRPGVGPPGRALAREPIPGAAPTPEAQAAEVAGIRQQFEGMPQAVAPPRGVAQEPFLRAEGARAPAGGQLARVGEGAGLREGHFDPLTSQAPEYVEAREMQRAGPAGIRRGTVGKYAAGETPFSQEQFERVNLLRKAEAAQRGEAPPIHMTPRELEARGAGPGARPEGGGVSIYGGEGPTYTAPAGIREYRPEEFVTRTGGQRILNVAALKTAGLNTQQIEAQQKQALGEAGLQQEAVAEQGRGLRAEKKLASEERKARYAGLSATGREAGVERRYGEKRETEQARYMTERVDKAAADISTRIEDGKRITIPGAEEEFRSFMGTSGGAQTEGGLNVMKSLFKFGKAAQRQQGIAQNPLQSWRNIPLIGGLIRGLDEKGTPMINSDQTKAVLNSYDPATKTYRVGAETIDESALGLEQGLVGKLLRDMLKTGRDTR